MAWLFDVAFRERSELRGTSTPEFERESGSGEARLEGRGEKMREGMAGLGTLVDQHCSACQKVSFFAAE